MIHDTALFPNKEKKISVILSIKKLKRKKFGKYQFFIKLFHVFVGAEEESILWKRIENVVMKIPMKKNC